MRDLKSKIVSLNLDEMEKFLDVEDEKEDRRRMREEKGMGADNDLNNDFEGIDMFGDDLGEDEEDENARYADYFESGVSGGARGTKRLLEDEMETSDEDMGEVKSSHEVRQQRLQKKIRKMEEEALKDASSESKVWQMKGEIAAVDRPENSLLQEDLDFDSVAKQAPIITEAVSRTLEDIIIQRIKDKAFDSVQRKVKPVENPYDYKKKLVLDQEKSKLSLARVYEQEYLKQQSLAEESQKTPGMLDNLDDEIPKEVEDIKAGMKILFSKLDTLTHFHYTPKMKDPEIKVIKAAPTLAMEEVAPVAMSDANLLAPQEILDKARGEEIGKSERTETDKRRDRRKKKARQSKQHKARTEKLVNKLNPGLGNKYSKERMMKELEQAEKQGKITTIKEDRSKSVKSSTKFFDQLQNEAQAVVKNARNAKSGLNVKGRKITASNLKL